MGSPPTGPRPSPRPQRETRRSFGRRVYQDELRSGAAERMEQVGGADHLSKRSTPRPPGAPGGLIHPRSTTKLVGVGPPSSAEQVGGAGPWDVHGASTSVRRMRVPRIGTSLVASRSSPGKSIGRRRRWWDTRAVRAAPALAAGRAGVPQPHGFQHSGPSLRVDCRPPSRSGRKRKPLTWELLDFSMATEAIPDPIRPSEAVRRLATSAFLPASASPSHFSCEAGSSPTRGLVRPSCESRPRECPSPSSRCGEGRLRPAVVPVRSRL